MFSALNNFGNVWIRDSSLFPETAIVKELSRHEFPQEIIDKVDPSHQKLYWLVYHIHMLAVYMFFCCILN